MAIAQSLANIKKRLQKHDILPDCIRQWFLVRPIRVHLHCNPIGLESLIIQSALVLESACASFAPLVVRTLVPVPSGFIVSKADLPHFKGSYYIENRIRTAPVSVRDRLLEAHRRNTKATMSHLKAIVFGYSKSKRYGSLSLYGEVCPGDS